MNPDQTAPLGLYPAKRLQLKGLPIGRLARATSDRKSAPVSNLIFFAVSGWGKRVRQTRRGAYNLIL